MCAEDCLQVEQDRAQDGVETFEECKRPAGLREALMQYSILAVTAGEEFPL